MADKLLSAERLERNLVVIAADDAGLAYEMQHHIEALQTKLTAAEHRASVAVGALEETERKLRNATAELAQTKSSLEMYAKAWARELGGKLIPKTHEIDALVLTTRWWQGRLEWADSIILGQQTYERFKEAFDLLCPSRLATLTKESQPG